MFPLPHLTIYNRNLATGLNQNKVFFFFFQLRRNPKISDLGLVYSSIMLRQHPTLLRHYSLHVALIITVLRQPVCCFHIPGRKKRTESNKLRIHMYDFCSHTTRPTISQGHISGTFSSQVTWKLSWAFSDPPTPKQYWRSVREEGEKGHQACLSLCLSDEFNLLGHFPLCPFLSGDASVSQSYLLGCTYHQSK